MAALTKRTGTRWLVPSLIIGAFVGNGVARAQVQGKLLTPPPQRVAAPAAQPEPASRPPSLLTPPATAPAGATPRVAATSTPPAREPAPAALASGLKLKAAKGSGILPNEHGQVWREYDITPYTLRIKDVARPQQAIIDWVLRETGTEVWFSEPLGVLSANSNVLRVYHTPEMHHRVNRIVERLVSGDPEARPLGLKLITIDSPNWRARALSLVKPVDVKSPGVEAWLLSRENAALLYDQLKTRGDFREHSAPRIEIANGQSQTLARTQPKKYVRSVQLKQTFPFYDLVPGQIDEGYSLEISPLLSLDGQTIEAAIECRVDQVEKLVPLAIDVPIGNQSQRVQIQVPQVASWRLSERFRWPASEVLLLSCGVVANPAPGASGVFSLLSPLGVSNGRADALLMIEQRTPTETALAGPPLKSPASPAIPVVR